MKTMLKRLLKYLFKENCKMNKDEELVKIFLRLNGYFLVDNFIVHNGDADLTNCREKIIPQLTETDMLGIRMPFQAENTGDLTIANYDKLILKNGLIDLVIVESKTGNKNRPNSTWKNIKKIENIKYLIRFFGITNDEDEIEKLSTCLLVNYNCEWKNYSIRYIIVSENINPHYSGKGITYITIEEIIDFIVKIRGECWINKNMGIASYHSQWNPFMNRIFEIANDQRINTNQRKKLIREYVKE